MTYEHVIQAMIWKKIGNLKAKYGFCYIDIRLYDHSKQIITTKYI